MTAKFKINETLKAGLKTVEIHRPLAEGNEPFDWINETRISPWRIYVIRKGEKE